MAVEKEVMGELDPLPAFVAVHGVVATDHGGDPGLGDFGDCLFEGTEKFTSRGGGTIAAIGDGMDKDFSRAGGAGYFQQSKQVVDMGVNAAVRDQSKKVDPFSRCGGERIFEGLVFGERAVADGEIDAGQLLINNSASTEVEMADLGVSHLPFGQADLQPAWFKPSPRVIVIQAVMDRGFGKLGGIALFFGPRASGGVDAPAIADQKENRFRHIRRLP